MIVNYDESCRELTINFCGEIDHHTCLETAKKTDDVIRKYLPQRVIFDFKDLIAKVCAVSGFLMF